MRTMLVVVAMAAGCWQGVPDRRPRTLPRSPPPAEVKSPALALGLAVGVPLVGTLTGVALIRVSDQTAAAVILPSLWIGPAAGRFYIGNYGRGATTTLVRIAATGLGVVALDMAFADQDGADPLALLAVGGFLGATLYDWFSTQREADAVNARHNVIVAPMIGSGTLGLSIGGEL